MNEAVTRLHIPEETVGPVPGVITAIVVGESADGRPLVRWGGGWREMGPARAVWMPSPPAWSDCKGLRAVLAFEDDDKTKPVLLGLLDSPPQVEELPVEAPVEPAPAAEATPEVLRLESAQELVLECGKAKISLRADGRVEILGGYVLSRSKGVNKIKGGSVQIN